MHEGKVLVVREAAYDEGTNTGKWDIPGGRIESDEPIMDGLRREVMEESGLTIEPIRLVGAGENFPSIKGESCHVVRLYYLADAITTNVTLSRDHDAYEWIDPQSVGEREFTADTADMIRKSIVSSN